MTEAYSFIEGEKEFYYRTLCPVRISPITNVRLDTRAGRKGKVAEATGFYLLNGEQRAETIEIPAGMWIFRSGADISKLSVVEGCCMIGLEERVLPKI